MEIGQKIKELRLLQKLSLEQLAREVGLTRSFLSQVEKNKTSPSIASLIKILGALNIRMADFFQSLDQSKGIVLRHGERKFFYDAEAKIRMASLSAGFKSPKMAPFYAEMEPGNATEIIQGQGQTFCFILSGIIELTLGETVYILHPGDSAYFDSSIPHCWRALSDIRASGVFVSEESLMSMG